MRLAILLGCMVIAANTMTPEEEACAAPLMKKLAKEPDAELKKFVMKLFKLLNAGKRDEMMQMGKKYYQEHPEKVNKFLDDYMVAECEVFRKEFDSIL